MQEWDQITQKVMQADRAAVLFKNQEHWLQVEAL
jgi:hypothetical protein